MVRPCMPARIHFMSAIRRWCLWLVMLALPLQGFAAASMLYCGQPSRAAQQADAAHHEAAQAVNHHASGHEGHDHAVAATPDVADHDPQNPTQDTHKCIMCALCGHSVALSESPETLVFDEPSHVSPRGPSVQIEPVAVRVPDKPPRA
jgi:hypothetical protein